MDFIVPMSDELQFSDIRGLGLGCSRFGSFSEGVDLSRAERLVETALSSGIRYFDTADIYGQGDSEILLGQALKKISGSYMVGTKVGQYFPTWQRALSLLKKPLKRLAGSAVKSRVASLRETPLPRSYQAPYVTAAVERSLRRLGMDTVDIVFLHSPPVEALSKGDAIGALDRLRTSGKLRMIGVSCDDLESARYVASDNRVHVLQLPVSSEDAVLSQILATARMNKMGIVGHSAFRRSRSDEVSGEQLDRSEIVRRFLRRSDVDVLLIGTTNPTHLKKLAAVAQ